MKSDLWIHIISWHFSLEVVNNVLALVISTTVRTVMLFVVISSFFIDSVWDGMRQLMATDMANLPVWKIHRVSTVCIGIVVICQETEVQLIALLIVSLRKVLVFILLLYWLAKQKLFYCTTDVAAARKEDICSTVDKESVLYFWVTTLMHSVLYYICLLCSLGQTQQGIVLVFSE